MNIAADAMTAIGAWLVDSAGWLLPSVHGNVLGAVLPGALQAALLWAVAGARWRRRQALWEQAQQP